ncbi:uncharacterized protein [Salvelinus alpinus]|uniref:uncharacterized protein n=1 Tax=Salvelinus alpinus TaxID=8036 RepID=UPI0039FDA9DF
MEAVFVLVLVMLAAVSHATDVTTCTATQNSSQCSVALCGTLDLQLMTNASGCELLFKKNLTDGPTLIFSLKRNTVTFKRPTEGRSQFFMNNGTFRLTNVERADSGKYFLEIYDSGGERLGTRRVQLDIEGLCLPMVLILGSVSAGGVVLAVMLVGCCIGRRRRRRIFNTTENLSVFPTASQAQTTSNHASPGPSHPASSPAGSSETSHPDSMETYCNATQNVSCYGALGGTVYLQLMNDATGFEITFKKDPTGANKEIFKMKQNKIIHEFIKARSEFFINNGTFKINNTEWSDSAKYSLEIHNSDGTYLDTRGVQLTIGGGSYGTVIGSLVAVVLVLAVVVGAYCIRKRRNPPQAPDADESPELECDDITILKKTEKQREVPEEVLYGQIVVLEGARPNTERDRPEGQEETLYAGIQLGQ